MCNKVCHTVTENALTVNCSLIFFSILSLTIKDKTNILHLRQGSFTLKVRTVFTLQIIVSIFVKLFLILVLHLRQFLIVRISVNRATDSEPTGLCSFFLMLRAQRRSNKLNTNCMVFGLIYKQYKQKMGIQNQLFR